MANRTALVSYIKETGSLKTLQLLAYRGARKPRHTNEEHAPDPTCSRTSLLVLTGYIALQGRCSPASYRSIMARTFSVLFAALVALQLCALLPVAVADHAGHDHSAYTTDDAGAHHSHSCPSFRLLKVSLSRLLALSDSTVRRLLALSDRGPPELAPNNPAAPKLRLLLILHVRRVLCALHHEQQPHAAELGGPVRGRRARPVEVPLQVQHVACGGALHR